MIVHPKELFRALKDFDFSYDPKSLKKGYIGKIATDKNSEPIIKLYTNQK